MALSGVEIIPGAQYFSQVLDAGTEMNSERCIHLPGPAGDVCTGTGNLAIGGGEGVVSVHTGIQEVGDLTQGAQGWTTSLPLLQVDISLPMP